MRPFQILTRFDELLVIVCKDSPGLWEGTDIHLFVVSSIFHVVTLNPTRKIHLVR